jgi:hypothetical protein
MVLTVSIFWACGDSTDSSSSKSQSVTLDLGLPNSLTGGTPVSASLQSSDASTRSGTGMPCVYLGSGDDDPFRNGYKMTNFMVSAVATWTCIADTLIAVADIVPHDGRIHSTDNVIGSPATTPKILPTIRSAMIRKIRPPFVFTTATSAVHRPSIRMKPSFTLPGLPGKTELPRGS